MNESKIIFDKSYNKDLCKILFHVIKNLYLIIDISTKLLEIVINNKEFIKIILFLQDQLYNKMLFDLKESVNINYNNIDLCGKVKTIYNNGYIEYCNIHRYLHINNNLSNQDQKCTDHLFIEKSTDTLELENKQLNIKNNYKKYLNILYKNIYNIIVYILYNSSTYEFIHMNDIIKIKEYYNYSLTYDKHIFKEKYLYDNNYAKIFTFNILKIG